MNSITMIISYVCVSKCRCKQGFARDYRGVCIPTKYCPGNTICPKNEVYDMRIPSCPRQATCSNLINEANRCGEDEVPTYIPACRCRRGYVRSGIRLNCIRPKNCICYQNNTIMVHYPNPCPGNTCQQPEFSKCDLVGKEWGCQCIEGHVRKSEGSYGCIPLSECKNVKPDPED
ncbi:inducible metalloproteinase inhibitor protein-like [Arctopsyche grandis]|uniref:inducible metalloproteinase inhibitor protein-like n=1 Tax=Arctopsyche grandis TaxID=121162 RepID=UPI00406D860A